MGAAADGEAPGVWALIGGVIVIAAIVAYNIQDSKQSRKDTVKRELREHC
jgi:drug/metabolite transporter (DMT)-like permease